jgi:hypothetical protein
MQIWKWITSLFADVSYKDSLEYSVDSKKPSNGTEAEILDQGLPHEKWRRHGVMKSKSKFRTIRMIFLSLLRFLLAWERYKVARGAQFKYHY